MRTPTSKTNYGANNGSPGSVRTLISTERIERFELLTHLLNNLRQPVVLSGPHGIGKSTYLSHIATLDPAKFHTLVIALGADDDYASVLRKIVALLGDPPPQQMHAVELERLLAHRLVTLEKTGTQLILGLDDTGRLPPGTFTQLCRYARFQKALHLVMTIRPDDLFLKSASDTTAVEECHILEIPPLHIEQCSEFLHQMVAQGVVDIPLRAITRALVEEIYQETHGVPGAIIELLPRYGRNWVPQQRQRLIKLDFVVNILLLLAIGMAILLIWRDASQPTVPTTLPIPNLPPPGVPGTTSGMLPFSFP